MQDANEKGIPGVKVTLWGDSNGNGTIDFTLTTTTDKDGHYKFLGLNPGYYYVTVNPFDLPRNVVQTTKYGSNLPYTDYARVLADDCNFDFGFKPYSAPTGCGHNGGAATPRAGAGTASGSAASATRRPRSARG